MRLNLFLPRRKGYHPLGLLCTLPARKGFNFADGRCRFVSSKAVLDRKKKQVDEISDKFSRAVAAASLITAG